MSDGVAVAVVLGSLTPAALCLWAGSWHVRRPTALARALSQPRLLRAALSSAAAAWVARVWGVVEMVTGAAVIAALLVPPAVALRFGVLVWLTIVYVVFSLWLIVRVRDPDASATCGCGDGDEPADAPALVRAVLLALFAFAALVGIAGQPDTVVPARAWAFVPVAVVLALLIWVLPAAMRPLGGA